MFLSFCIQKNLKNPIAISSKIDIIETEKRTNVRNAEA